MKRHILYCLMYVCFASFVQNAEAKMVYKLDGHNCSRQEYQGAEIAEEGHKYLNAGRLPEAAERLRKAASLAPRVGYIQSNLAYVLVKLGKPEEAIPHLKAAVKIQRGNADSVRALSAAYVSVGKLQDATALLDEFSEKHASDPAAAEIASYCKQLHKELTAQGKVEASATSVSDYLAYTTAEEGSVRWEFNRLPLKVFVAPVDRVRGYQPEFANEMQNAFRSWEEATNGKVRFVQAASKEEADLTLTWTDNVRDLDSPDEGGEARVKFGSKGVTHSDIFILTHNDLNGRECTPNQVYGVCLHEIGHSLGLLNHSPDAHDIMYFSDRNSTQRPQLSSRDKSTLNLLYETAKAYVPKQGSAEELASQKADLFNSAIQDYNEGRYEQAVKKCESVLKMEPGLTRATRLMADALDNHAASLMEQKDYLTAEPLVKRALEVRRSMGTDGDLYDTLYNYAIILRALNRTTEAEKYEAEASAARVISRN